MLKHLTCCGVVLTFAMAGSVHADQIFRTTVWKSGEGSYHTYRIPSVIRAKNGTLLAFCEGRKSGQGDAGNIDLLLKRSSDGGKTWTDNVVLWDDNGHTCGNPCPVVDESTGTIWLLLTRNLGTDHESDIIHKKAESTRTVWVSHSSDDGRTWTAPSEITATTKDQSWGWYATGPGVGIQIQHGPHAGRLVIPCDHSYDDPNGKVRGGPYEYGAHSIHSDDHGKTWQMGGTIRPKTNECQVVELDDGHGSLLMNMRSYFNRKRRTHSISKDGGATWPAPLDAPQLVEPVCQGSIIRHRWSDGARSDGGRSDNGIPGVLLFSNPASEKGRVNLTVRASFDDGVTWPLAQALHTGPAAYSCLVSLPDDAFGCLYEAGEKSAYESIVFHRLPDKSLQLP
ncbi:MAG: sialidase family protein [Planctomycetota bacterium]|nr:sialidase family protein [Planctomycetota bacterium]MDA1161849.1 sialidase family protein [Planctomycetota bacterium]